MAQYAATVRDDRTLELPLEARKYVQPGQLVVVDVPADSETLRLQPNRAMIAALDEIARRQHGRRHTDGSETDATIRDGRAGQMYDHGSS